MIKAIIFDFDGVIADTEHKKFEDLKEVTKNTPYSLKDSDFNLLIGKKTKSFFIELFPNIHNKDLKEILEKRRKIQYNNLEGYSLIKGLKKLLDYLLEKRIKMAICTGSEKKFIEKILEKQELQKYFNSVISGEMFSSSKPDPECYKLALLRLNLNPSEALVIEDSPAGISSAKKTGCKVLAVSTYLHREKLNEADKIFSNHEKILEYIKYKQL